jgi:hypothetical protein
VMESTHASAARLVLADTTDTSHQNPTLDPAALQASIPKRSSPALFILGGVAVLAATLGYAAVRSKDARSTDANFTSAAVGSGATTTTPAAEIPPPPSTLPAIAVSSLPQASAQPPPTGVTKIQPISRPSAHPAANVTAPTPPQPTAKKPAGAYDDFGERK